jgi:hypothetical protein
VLSVLAAVAVPRQYCGVSRITLHDGAESFDITALEATHPSHVVLFAVGGGGNPERHLPLLKYLADRGCTVVAPHFERLASSHPTQGELLLRGRRLSLALDSVACHGLLVAGVGHSIGATMLLGLAGGQVWMHSGQCLPVIPDGRLERLALLAPATGFFQAPGALDAVSTPLRVWVGTADAMTPPVQTMFLKHTLGARVPVEVTIVEGAGHFSFMNEPPPQMPEPHPNREAFLVTLAAELCGFVTG